MLKRRRKREITRYLVQGYYKMNTGSGQTLYDKGIQGNDLQLGSLVGADSNDPSWTGGVLAFSTDDFCKQKALATMQGTVTASMVNGAAFINDSGQTFTSYLRAYGVSNYTLMATDAAGKVAFGYIGEIGTGRTLGSNGLTNGDNEAALVSTITDINGTTTQSDEQAHAGTYSAKFTCDAAVSDHYTRFTGLTVGALYEADTWVYLPSSQTTTRLTLIGTNGSPAVDYTELTDQWVNLTGDLTLTSDWAGILGNETVVDGEYWYQDDLAFKQVLTPTSNGVVIYSTKTGTTQNWTLVESGFNANTIASYSIRKADFQITGDLTIGTFIKGAASSGKGILSKSDTTSNQRGYLILSGLTSPYAKFVVAISQTGSSAGKTYESSITVLDNTWHFILFTYSTSDVLKLYVDGVEDTSVTKTVDNSVTSLFDSATILYLSCYEGGHAATGYFTGSFANLVIESRTLSSGEVLSLYKKLRANMISRGLI